MKRIIVIGAGFAGVYATIKLLKLFKKGFEVVLINKSNYFLFQPMLHEVATGSLSGHNIAEPIREIIKAKNFRFVKCSANKIELKKQVVHTTHEKISYDYLFISAGAKVNFFGTPGARENTLTLKGLPDARKIKNHIIGSLEDAFEAKTKVQRDRLSTVVIVGAGATGIELGIEAMELMNQIVKSKCNSKVVPKVLLLQKGKEVLPQFPAIQKKVIDALLRENVKVLTNNAVSEVKKGAVLTKAGKRFNAKTIIWTAGITPSNIPTSPNVANDKGQFIVNEFLQLEKFANVFVLGDYNSYTPTGEQRPMPNLAQVASEQGKHAAKNLYRLHYKKKMVPFKFNLRGIMMSLGKRKGVAFIKGVTISGFPAWFFLRTIYLFKIVGKVNRLKTAYEWTLNLFAKRDTVQD